MISMNGAALNHIQRIGPKMELTLSSIVIQPETEVLFSDWRTNSVGKVRVSYRSYNVARYKLQVFVPQRFGTGQRDKKHLFAIKNLLENSSQHL